MLVATKKLSEWSSGTELNVLFEEFPTCFEIVCFTNELDVVDINPEHELKLRMVEDALPVGDLLETTCKDGIMRLVLPVEASKGMSI